ncbi:hypothetical protein QOZ80_5AG0377470 [Eleusine coracana subsp. coracana]|nr:hypothetical protein QOZ80_5AG0377440 [Eleusine coracana subsp. coracana]KAK3139077.1 hypothetical protein QOZ80_5AG0377450 [Eleusine coracana subsp. coracana]KAK3139078.1 hypothetical protein QOZ80_5AG0377460 [Eleusine coracana subsp. coracana]KAK3139079.1 hypothetical protein QOZ80_5AG0377470 [Eleusine coracana subsp. coracana]
MAMASAAAISSNTLLLKMKRPPLVRPAIELATPPMMVRHRPRSSATTTCAAVQTAPGKGGVKRRARGGIQLWTLAPVISIRPANEDKTIFLITLDLSDAREMVDSYTTPGQYLLTSVLPSESPEKRLPFPAYMCISSAPRSGLHFDLLVRSVPGTMSELLCNLNVGDLVELGPIRGNGFAIQNINPPPVAETVFLFAYTEGISPVRSLIEYGFGAHERTDVKLFFADKSLRSMPYQDRFKKWESTGVKVEPLTQPIDEAFLEENVDITNPHSTGAVIVGPDSLKQRVTGYLTDHGVTNDKILTIEWPVTDPFRH